MKNLHIIFFIFLLNVAINALDLKSIIALHKAKVSDKVIITIIHTSEIRKLSIQDIVKLSKHGVSDKVIVALVKKINKQEKKRNKQERKPFDQFFLSPYYSHQYGWPKANYKSPREILEQGLYYRGPTEYPNASRVRVYGWGYNIKGKGPYYQYSFSPFSIIVPRKHRCRSKRKYRTRRRYWKPAPVYKTPYSKTKKK